MTETTPQTIARALADGGVALAPTDTVYGLLAAPTRPEAQDRIFKLKKRPQTLNLQILLPKDFLLSKLGLEVPSAASKMLADAEICPSITFIFPLNALTKPDFLSHRIELGVRVPADQRIQAVLALTGPLFATSANAHGEPQGRTPAAILAQLDGRPDAVWDAGELGGEASTVINFNADPPAVLRWGVVRDLSAYGLGHG